MRRNFGNKIMILFQNRKKKSFLTNLLTVSQIKTYTIMFNYYKNIHLITKKHVKSITNSVQTAYKHVTNDDKLRQIMTSNGQPCKN